MITGSSKFRSIQRLLRDRAGNFGILTALLLVPVSLAAGAAIDYSTAIAQRTNLQEIADSAALAGGEIYDGTNFSTAKATAQAFIDAYAATTPIGLASNITANGNTLQVTLTGSVPTTLMRLGNVNNVDISVNAASYSPPKPQQVTLTPTKAQGYYYKKVTIRVVRPNTTSEVVLGTVTYQPTTHNDSGQGTMVVNPPGAINLGQYTKLVLQMDIKDDGCPTGQTASVSSNNAVKCSKSSRAADQKYDLTLRTDNPDTSYYLFVNGQQLPKGITVPIENYFGCQSPQNHAWEDGGGWERQDIFYTISSVCASADGAAVRLTQ
ncbi:pilus assembly protein [Rhizobium jaguaris]|uniref:Pilus assembly protein n=1 Tax=Rhizobium jaguaris TaxID=1312183 RepID=A0A387FLY6_9HYPH|nr:TadE/TadG family type IV pilus assembly protein [Rhizobium jaguaris]AYG60450.1 pilus assembly protein [Rhizobium jaguaris]